MPLVTRPLVNIVGLNTEGSPIDPLAMPPNSLADCNNITFTKSGQAVSRKGHPVWVDLYGASAGSIVYPILTQHFSDAGESILHALYHTGTTSGAQSAVVYNDTLDTATGIVQYTGTGTPIRTATLPSSVSNPDLCADLSGEFRSSHFVSQNRSYFTARNGLFRSEPDVSLNDNRRYKKVQLPSIKEFTAATVATTLSKSWLLTGNQVRLTAIVTEYLETGEQIESPPASEEILQNVEQSVGVNITISALCPNIRDLSRAFIKIYRTRQYAFGEAAPTVFRECYSAALSTYATMTGDLATFNTISLTLNDDALDQFPELYTDVNVNGKLGEHVPVPTATSVTTYKDYTIYGGVTAAPYMKLSMTQIPANTDVLTVSNGVNSVAVTLNSKANSTSTPPTTGKMTATDYTFKGLGAVSKLVIRPVNPSNPTTATYKSTVPFYAATGVGGSVAVVSAVNNTATLRITGTDIFDLDRFASPKGCFAIVDGATAGLVGRVLDIVTYDDFEQIPGLGIEFYGTQSKRGFSNYPLTGVLYFYALTIADTNNLPIYPISTDADATAFATGYSLLPTFYSYPDTNFMQTAVGIAGGISWSGSDIQCTPVFAGLLWNSEGSRLKKSVIQLVKDYNKAAARTSYLPYARYVENNTLMLVGSLVGGSTVTNASTVSNLYNNIQLSLSPAAVVKFDEDIKTTAENFANDVALPNLLMLSNANRSECVSLQYLLTPERIGDDNKRIQQVVTNSGQLYVFKDTEGIYRVEVQEGLTVPMIASKNPLDNTTWLVGDNTLQELRESLFFLSNKGVAILNNNTLTVISYSIESEIKDAITRSTQNGYTLSSILSFKNEFRRQYGLYFPATGTTYVYDAFVKQWSKWERPFTSALAKSDGRLITALNPTAYYAAGGVIHPSVLYRDSYANGGIDNPLDQYDAIETGVTKTQVGINVAFTKSGGTGYNQNLAYLAAIYNMSTNKVYARIAGVCYPLTYVSSVPATATLNFTADDGVTLPAGTTDLVIGVNASITFNRFYESSLPGTNTDQQPVPSSPQGIMTLSQFSEYHLQMVGGYTGVRIGFEADNYAPTFPAANFVTLPKNYDIIRVQVPRNQMRGRWIQAKVEHSYPFERFLLAGAGWVLKSLETFRVKTRSR